MQKRPWELIAKGHGGPSGKWTERPKKLIAIVKVHPGERVKLSNHSWALRTRANDITWRNTMSSVAKWDQQHQPHRGKTQNVVYGAHSTYELWFLLHHFYHFTQRKVIQECYISIQGSKKQNFRKFCSGVQNIYSRILTHSPRMLSLPLTIGPPQTHSYPTHF